MNGEKEWLERAARLNSKTGPPRINKLLVFRKMGGPYRPRKVLVRLSRQ
jgi:hypothetical protein